MVNDHKPSTQVQRRSVQETGPISALESAGDGLVLRLSTVADSFTPWGAFPRRRDWELRQFWPTEPILASALYTTIVRNAAFSWTLEGPPQSVKAVQGMLHRSDFGRGWSSFITKFAIDLMTQDNGAFVEVIRATDSPTAPVWGLANLDAGRCRRTADPDFPVIYVDRKGRLHKMKWYQVHIEAEFPSPVETMFGMQLCAVSRVLAAAQLLRDISVYQREKIGGDNPNAIYLVGGVPSQTITDAMTQHKKKQAERGMARYVVPLVVASLDPTATVSVAEIALKTLPDGFDTEEAMRWYINQLAMGFGADYQDFAPLPGKGLGTSTQSKVLHDKARGRGPAMFMSMIENMLNFHGILPGNVLFRYDEQDVQADLQQAELEKTTAETLTMLVEKGVLTPEAARQQLLDKGMISNELFMAIQEGRDLTPDIVAQDTEPAETGDPSGLTGGVMTAERYHTADDKADDKADDDDEPVFADFQEAEKLDLEATMQARMAVVLDRAFRNARKVMGLPSTLPGSRAMGDVRAALGRKAGPEDIFTNDEFWSAFKDDAIAAMGPMVSQGALEAAQFNVGLGISVDMNLVNQEVLGLSKRFTTQWWDELEVGTRKGLRTAVVSWQEGGLGRRGLPDLTRALEPVFGRARAERIAVTEVTQIFDEGNRIAHNAAGIETEEWQTVRDAKVDDICRTLDKKRFPTNSGPRPVKDTHINCRCARLPVSSQGETLGR
jgi:SPP1 gp7 family putative phage head morphogenesis protein